MNQQQLAAYEALCAKVPEAFFDATARYFGDHKLAILTEHLERMLPPGASLHWPWQNENRWQYSAPVLLHLYRDPDRFIALCRAVEASR